MNITLIGYRGTGKTTVGRQLAARLHWDFFDIDPEIERRGGKSIAAIFAEDGEPHFRDVECGVLADQLARDRVVVCTGGGTVLRDSNRELMRKAGPVVWLRANVYTIQARMTSDPRTERTRPPLTGTDRLTEIPSVLAQRIPLYLDVATIVVKVDGRTASSIVDEIVSQLPPEAGA